MMNYIVGMRDDIHNKVPLSPAFRALIRRCVLPAYQQQTENLTPYAVKAVARLIAGGCSQSLINSLAAEFSNPTLYGVSTVSMSNASTFQSDLIFALGVPNQTPQQALIYAAKSQIDGMCLEATASLRAAGASRSEAFKIDHVMRAALGAAVDNVTARLIAGGAASLPKSVLSISSALPLGSAARLAK